ncbi:hypothetical protein Ocin01_19398 [Orchesella cincta]|uniref:Uncharacterized protein n=1 Tax=Orchesella cincta TaxID=48709 RepID=A0A1D2M2T5_ORCCI|nr:hypothetical protein Ocin01_19398 [Orchesella cincta]
MASHEVIQLNREALAAAGESVQIDQEKSKRTTLDSSHSRTCSMFSVVSPPTRCGRKVGPAVDVDPTRNVLAIVPKY